MPLAEVQKLAQEPGSVTEVVAAAEGGTSPEQLKASISKALGGTAVVRTGKEQAEESASDITDSLGFLKIGLLVFAGVAVLVGGFLIFNTFAVTVAQRSREFALLRTLGASRRQVLNSVIAETLVIGFVASVAGILVGVVLAPALRALLASFGIELPSTGTVIAARTVIVGLLVGMIATLVSGLVPARRATHVEPVEAMRDAVIPGTRRVSRRRLLISTAVIGIGLAAPSVRTSHRACTAWPTMVPKDRTLTAALLDRRRQPAEPVRIEGQRCPRHEPSDGGPALPTASPAAHRPCR